MIHNFGTVVPGQFYRGAQPRECEYVELARRGVTMVIDLCDDDRKDYARVGAGTAGLLYHSLPMSDRDYPGRYAAAMFIELATDPKRQAIFVHCAGGRHRTGAMTAVYRMKIDGWSLKQALDELESYFGFWRGLRWIGHGKIKQFVKDYAKESAK